MNVDLAVARALSWLATPRARVVIGVVALLLLSPCLFGPFVLDDHVFELLARSDPGIRGFRSRPFELLTFTTGIPAENRALMDEGALLPWWTEERHLNALFRPISVLTHRVDLALFPDSAFLMHLHGLLWFALLVFVVVKLYDRLGTNASIAGLALLFFAWDDVHGGTVAWTANRNSIIAVVGVASALYFHHRSVEESSRRARALATLSVAFALGGAESGVIVFPYLVAYAVAFDRAKLFGAVARLAPYLVVFVLWRVVYKHGGFGTFASEVYLDPGAHPAATASAFFYNVPCLLASQFGPGVPFADLMLWSEKEWRPLVLAAAWADVLLMLLFSVGALRAQRETRFWALATLLAAAPLATSANGDRLLLPVGIAASAFAAEVVGWLVLRVIERRSGSPGLPVAALMAAVASIVLVNAVEAPIALPFRAYAMGRIGKATGRADAGIPRTADIEGKTVIVANAPVDVLVSYLQVARARTHTPRPRHLYWLATASSAFSVERTSDRSLRLTKPRGMLESLPERHYRASWFPLARGASVSLGDFRARVVDVTADGRPSVVDFSFDEPLDSSRYVVLAWDGERLVPWDVAREPTRHFPGETFFHTMFGVGGRSGG